MRMHRHKWRFALTEAYRVCRKCSRFERLYPTSKGWKWKKT